MDIEKKQKEISKILVFFSIVYTSITIYFFYDIVNNESASIGYLFVFPAFWLVGILLLTLLCWLTKVKLDSMVNLAAFIFSTPVPAFVFIGIWACYSYLSMYLKTK